MTCLSGVLRVATEEYGWLEVNPLARVRKPLPSRGHVRFLLQEERTRLLASCLRSRDRMLYPFVVITLSTGGRREEGSCTSSERIIRGSENQVR
jgi:hypothetical protein